MTNSIVRTASILLLTFAAIARPTCLVAQTTNSARNAAEKKQATEKKNVAGPFHSKLVAVDKAGKTITVGKRTFLITSESKLNKAGKPATIDDAVVGEEVSGYVKPNEEGKLVATKVNFGPKTDAKTSNHEKKKKE
jgi:hypothetical protein